MLIAYMLRGIEPLRIKKELIFFLLINKKLFPFRPVLILDTYLFIS